MIYLVTTLNLKQGPRYKSRAVGYFETILRASEVVEGNELDINEDGYYPYALIEGVPPGLYPDCKEYWFKWEGDIATGKYVGIAKPESEKRIRNYGIG